MHTTSAGRRVCRLSLLLTSRSAVLRSAGQAAAKKLRELSEYMEAQNVDLRKLLAEPSKEECSTEEFRAMLATLGVVYIDRTRDPRHGERRHWGAEDVEAVVHFFDDGAHGTVFMSEVEVTLMRAMQPETKPVSPPPVAMSTMLPQLTSMGRQRLGKNRHEPRATFNHTKRFVPQETGAGVLGPGAYLKMQLPSLDGRRRQPGKYERKGQTQGIGVRPGPEQRTGGASVPFSPVKSTVSRRAPTMSGRDMFRDFIRGPLKQACGPGPGSHGGAPSGARLSAMALRQPQSKARNATTVDVGSRAKRPLDQYPRSETMRAPVQYSSGQMTGSIVANSTQRTGPQYSFNCGIETPNLAKSFADPKIADRVAARQAKAMNKHCGNCSAAFFGLLAN